MPRVDEYHLERLNKLHHDICGRDLTYPQAEHLKPLVIRHKLTGEEVEKLAVGLLQKVDHRRKLICLPRKARELSGHEGIDGVDGPTSTASECPGVAAGAPQKREAVREGVYQNRR